MDDEGRFSTGHQTKTHPNQVARIQFPLGIHWHFK
jgi:hypothetical protein